MNCNDDTYKVDYFSKKSIKFKSYQIEHINEMCCLMLNQVAQKIPRRV